MKRRSVSPFSLSFLDIMFCGFGAVVLLVLILNTDTVKARNQTFSDLRSDVVRLEKEVLVGRKDMVEARNSLEATDREQVKTQGQTERVIQKIRELELEIASLDRETRASKQHVNRLSSDLKKLDEKKEQLGADAVRKQDSGDKIRRVTGEGDRQYLTGLKVGGKRILVLVDASASMLDETIVNIVRRRNMKASQKRNAPKWQRTLAVAEWLVSNLPADVRFQVYTFNASAQPVVTGSGGKWLSTASKTDVEQSVSALRKVIPDSGTSLHKAFAVIKKISPKPDNVLLITDGLPTQGRSKPGGTTVTADQRLTYFQLAASDIPGGIPVNTILMPMEGDAWAAAAYWRLAIDTKGSFMTPARDWP